MWGEAREGGGGVCDVTSTLAKLQDNTTVPAAHSGFIVGNSELCYILQRREDPPHLCEIQQVTYSPSVAEKKAEHSVCLMTHALSASCFAACHVRPE